MHVPNPFLFFGLNMLSNFEIKKGEVNILTSDKMSIKAFQTANAFIGLFFV